MNSADRPLEDLPGFMLRRAANDAMGALADRLTAIDLRISDSTLLILLDQHDALTAADIGRKLDIKRANMVPLLNRLEDAGLVARRPVDGRSQAIELTKDGRKKLSEANAIVHAFEADLLERVPPEHREHLLPALRAISGID